jgi:hypothetical protein
MVRKKKEGIRGKKKTKPLNHGYRRGRRGKGMGNIFDNKIAENFPSLVKEMFIQVQDLRQDHRRTLHSIS